MFMPLYRPLCRRMTMNIPPMTPKMAPEAPADTVYISPFRTIRIRDSSAPPIPEQK